MEDFVFVLANAGSRKPGKFKPTIFEDDNGLWAMEFETREEAEDWINYEEFPPGDPRPEIVRLNARQHQEWIAYLLDEGVGTIGLGAYYNPDDCLGVPFITASAALDMRRKSKGK
jgi:hypothetical protein